MFRLRVHSVDTDHPLSPEDTFYTSTSNPKLIERRGIVHLFRSISDPSQPSPSIRSTHLFVVAVPNYFSSDEFIRFCGSHIDNVLELHFIRNDGMEDRYCVLIELRGQLAAEGLYKDFNGKRFSPAETEVCHILFMLDVEYTESDEVAGTPPEGFAELPTCPVCLERLDPDTSGILSTLCDHSFQCSCISKWTYLSCQVCQICQQQEEKPKCSFCGTLENLWICVICGFIGCGRYKEGHAKNHWIHTQHCYSLDLTTQQIWDYVGDNYVHRLNQSKGDGKLGEMNTLCPSHEGDCGTCECSEQSGISTVLFSSKVEAIVDEYNRLLATQLETQRQHYESLILDAKSKSESAISEVVETIVASKIQDIQHELEKCVEEKKAVADTNQNLIKNQKTAREKLEVIEVREKSSLKMRNDKICDLEEQIRDLRVYMEAQKKLDNMSDDIKGGTLLPVPPNQSSPHGTKRRSKLGRKRN